MRSSRGVRCRGASRSSELGESEVLPLLREAGSSRGPYVAHSPCALCGFPPPRRAGDFMSCLPASPAPSFLLPPPWGTLPSTHRPARPRTRRRVRPPGLGRNDGRRRNRAPTSVEPARHEDRPLTFAARPRPRGRLAPPRNLALPASGAYGGRVGRDAWSSWRKARGSSSGSGGDLAGVRGQSCRIRRPIRSVGEPYPDFTPYHSTTPSKRGMTCADAVRTVGGRPDNRQELVSSRIGWFSRLTYPSLFGLSRSWSSPPLPELSGWPCFARPVAP